MFIIKKHKETIVRVILILLLILVLLSYFYIDFISEIVNIILISFIISSLLNPLCEYMSSYKYLNRKISSLILVLLLILLLSTIVFTVFPTMFKELNNSSDLINSLKSYINNFENSKSYKEGVIVKFLYNQLKNKGEKWIAGFSGTMINQLISISNSIIVYAVVPVATYYFLSDRDKMKKKLYKVIPASNRSIIRKIIADCNGLLGGYLRGQIILSAVIAIATFIILLLFNVKLALGLSILNGAMNIIPYFGPIFGAVPIVIVAFLESTNKGVLVTIALLALQQIEGNILSPKITGDSTDMHPMVIIILLLIGESVGGFWGMLIAVPLGVIVKVIYEDIDYYLF